MAKLLPSVPVHDGGKFHWSGNEGTADLSDFVPANLAGRLYADACDVGFYVVSQRTGRKVLFTESDVERREGELVAYHYEADGGLHITVFND